MALAFPDPLAEALAHKAETAQAGAISGKALAAGDGWRVVDFVCTCGPADGKVEEQHVVPSVSVVLAGTFACRSAHGASLLSAGSLFLGSTGECFECSHQHGDGDRCLSFQYEAAVFEQIVSDAGAKAASFGRNSLPPLRTLAPLAARAAVATDQPAVLEEVAYELAGAALRMAHDIQERARPAHARHEARIADTVRYMESRLDERHTISDLARRSTMSPFYFVRTFKHVTGVTPHQWLVRARLRAAAQRLCASRAPITQIALEVGFEDLSNFVRSFRAEFGVSPRQYRAAA